MSGKSIRQRHRSSRYDVGSVSRRLTYPENIEHVDALVRVSSENKGTKTPSQPARVDFDFQKAATLNISQTSLTFSAESLQSRQWAENWINNNFELATESFTTVCDVYEQYQSAANAAGEGVLPARGNNCFGTALKNAFQDSNILIKDRDDDDHTSFYSSLSCSPPTADRRSDSQLAAKEPKRSFLSAAPSRADLIVIPSDPKEQRAWFEAKKARKQCTGCGYFVTEAACAAHQKFDVRCGKGKFCPRCAEIFIGPDAKRHFQIHLQTCESVEYLPIKHVLPGKQTKSHGCADSEEEDEAANESNYLKQLKSFHGADISEEFISEKLLQLRGRVAHQDSRQPKAPNNPLIFKRDFDTPPPTRPRNPQASRHSHRERDEHVIAPAPVTVRPNGRMVELLKAERKGQLPLSLSAESLKRMPPALESSKRALEWMAGAGFPQNIIGKDVPLNSDNFTNSKFKKLMR